MNNFGPIGFGVTAFRKSLHSQDRPGHARERVFSRLLLVLSLCTQDEEAMQTTKVGIREFRENLADYLESKTPVAITRHGATIGIYVPTKPKPSQADLEALRIAGEKMQELIAAAGTSEDEIVADFKKMRRERQTTKKS